MMAICVRWGTVLLKLDNCIFQKAYQKGRAYHFDTWCGADPRTVMTAEQIMGLVALPDDQGRYELDDEHDRAEEIIGFVLGYMSGPWLPEAPTERAQREQRYCQDGDRIDLPNCSTLAED